MADNLRNLKIIFISLFITFSIVLANSIYIFIYIPDLYSQINGLLNTGLATTLSIWLAVYIYYRQLRDKFISHLNSLNSIFKTLIDDFKNITTERERLHENYLRVKQKRTIDICKSIIINAINSGNFKDDSKGLIELLHVINNFYGSIYSLKNNKINEETHFSIYHDITDHLQDLVDDFTIRIDNI